jgi:hypothetical protein
MAYSWNNWIFIHSFMNEWINEYIYICIHIYILLTGKQTVCELGNQQQMII